MCPALPSHFTFTTTPLFPSFRLGNWGSGELGKLSRFPNSVSGVAGMDVGVCCLSRLTGIWRWCPHSTMPFLSLLRPVIKFSSRDMALWTFTSWVTFLICAPGEMWHPELVPFQMKSKPCVHYFCWPELYTLSLIPGSHLLLKQLQSCVGSHEALGQSKTPGSFSHGLLPSLGAPGAVYHF